MMSSNTSRVAAVLLAAGLAAATAIGCSSSDSPTPMFPSAGAAPVAGASPAGGASPSAGAGGSAQTTAGAGGTVAAAGAGGTVAAAGAGGTVAAAGAGGGTPANTITAVVKTAGCGMDPTGLTPSTAVRGTVMTSGTKAADAADSKKGPWSYEREYFVTLPANYDKNKAYPIVFQGPGCGGGGKDVYPLTPDAMTPGNVNNTVIRVGLTPPPKDIGHATNPNDGCFDDKEGDDSVDWTFYEVLYDKLAASICFDKNRVFASGNSSGSWFSNELGCKYAGDPTRPVRGIMPNTGGLPTEAKYVPTCTTKPMAGMWVHEINDMTNSFTGNKVAIARAMAVNGCTIGNGYDNTMFDDYPIGGGQAANVCKKIKGCPELYPLVVCALPGSAHGSHDNVTNPGFSTFLKMFSAGTFITQ